MSSDEVKLDLKRPERIGFGEAIFCEGKAPEHLTRILETARDAGHPLLLTRLSEPQRDTLPAPLREALDYEALSRTAFFGSPAPLVGPTRVGVVGAGTSDARVTREVVRTLRFNGVPTVGFMDIGVAGLWRLQERLEELRRLPVLVVAAGMDAALPTVLAGLVPGVIIGVPTSTGYGATEGGRTALHAMLSSCAPGVAVMNIDNGYGAACAALRVLRAMGGGPDA